jgi:N-acetylmuramoyl-L-alanine amidase
MSLKIGINLTRYYSINFDTPKRNRSLIKFVIIHYTGMRKESEAIKKLCDIKSKVSAHYFIKKNGEVLNLVPDLYTAWHAGKSRWKKFRSLNKYSIGIEISNSGHDFKYTKFSKNQISELEKLLRFLIKKYKIQKQNILGHSDISPFRKKDPGEKFPWKQLADKKLCKWHSLNEKKLKESRNSKLSSYEKRIFFKNLFLIGYSKTIGLNLKSKKIKLIKAFQMRFRQNLINGIIDKECFLISKNLLK